MSGSWRAEWAARAAAGQLPRAPPRQLPCHDPRVEVGEEVHIGVGPVEFIALDNCGCAVAKFSKSRRKYPYFRDTLISLKHGG